MRMPLSALTHVAPAAEGPGPVRQVFETLDDASAYREFCTQARASCCAPVWSWPSGRSQVTAHFNSKYRRDLASPSPCPRSWRSASEAVGAARARAESRPDAGLSSLLTLDLLGMAAMSASCTEAAPAAAHVKLGRTPLYQEFLHV